MSLTDWINSQQFKFAKTNIRPWGTYELAVSADGGVTWARISRPFGSGFTEEHAFEILLTESLNDSILLEQLTAWLGQPTVEHLQSIRNPPTNVPEHLHIEPNTG